MALPRRRSGRTTTTTAVETPFRQPRNPLPPIEPLSEAQLSKIEDASFRILENTGIEFLSPRGLALWEQVGAKVDHSNKRVRVDRGFIQEKIKTAPSQFTLHARNPAHNTIMGGDYMIFASVSAPGFASDIKRGRRAGSYADLVNFIKLSQSFNVIHNIGGFICENQDHHEATRHLDLYLAQHIYADKCIMPSALGYNHAHDAVEMAAIVHGGHERIRQHPVTMTIINSNSPLRFDTPMIDGMTRYVEAGQAVSITPFTLAGAMAPITLAGAIAQQNAEALFGIAYTQMLNPGNPVVYGAFTSNVDMQTGSPAFATPEGAWASLIGGQLARRYHLPYRASNVANSKAPDAQAGWESMNAMWPVMLGHANYVLHAAGWMDAGLIAGYEKFIIDVEVLQLLDAFMMNAPTIDDDALGLDAIDEVGPGGHFFGTPHTMARYRDAFYRPMLSDWQNYGNWVESGSLTAADRAYQKAQDVLAAYEQPPLDPAIKEELDAYVARRRRDILPNQ
ncbi:MAG: trimethylamine methyltransferase family protein [Anaerolineae bacterium]|nr:trimethylamine methyltransferase family protein [Anaerolineae bacterium]